MQGDISSRLRSRLSARVSLLARPSAPVSSLARPSAHFDRAEQSARAELFRLRARHWRTQLSGAVLLTVMVAWGLDIYARDGRTWIWAACIAAICTTQAWYCLWLDRIPTDAVVPLAWWRGTHVLAVCIGCAWSSLPWLLPGDSVSLQLLSAFSSTLVVLASSSSSSSTGLLLAVWIPALLLIPSALLLHAGIPVASFVTVLLLLLILQHGLSLQRAMLESIRLRLHNEALAESLGFEQRKALAALRQQDLLQERQRMTQDLHDGLGSTLVSTLMALEAGRLPHTAVPAILRDCVDDLRIVIDSMELEEQDLMVVMGTIRHRLGSRLQMAGLNLQWEIEDLPPLPWLGPSQALQIMRIVQEALINALKHAQASTVQLSTRNLPNHDGSPRIAIVVHDDGIGFDPTRQADGRGLKNMSLRAQQLGAELHIDASPGSGTSLTIYLPIARETFGKMA